MWAKHVYQCNSCMNGTVVQKIKFCTPNIVSKNTFYSLDPFVRYRQIEGVTIFSWFYCIPVLNQTRSLCITLIKSSYIKRTSRVSNYSECLRTFIVILSLTCESFSTAAQRCASIVYQLYSLVSLSSFL